MRRKMLSYILMLAMVLGTLTGCQAGSTSKSDTATSEETELYVFVAASLSNAMGEIQTKFKEANPGIKILINADSSGTLQKQIEEGATCDVFFSAATKQMTALMDKGLVVDGTVKNLLENQVVLIKAKGAPTSVTGFEDITKAKSLALAGEDVPVGQYAREIFTSLGNIDDVLAMEVNEGANVTAVLTAVSEKSNEVGVVYSTDAASMPDTVEVISVAPQGTMKKPAVYPVGQIVHSNATDAEGKAAQTFLDYLSADEALAVFESYGFAIHKE